MKKVILLFMVVIALSACNTQPSLNGTWISAYSYPTEIPAQKNIPYKSNVKVFLVSDKISKILYLDEGNVTHRKAKNSSINQSKTGLVLNYDEFTDSLQIISLTDDSLVCQLNNEIIVYKRLPELLPIQISKSDFKSMSRLGENGLTDTLDFVNGSYFFHRTADAPTVVNWDLVKFNNYIFIERGMGMLMPSLITKVENGVVTLKTYFIKDTEATLTPITPNNVSGKLLGKWLWKDENAAPPVFVTDSLPKADYYMSLGFTQDSVTTFYYGKTETVQWNVNSAGDLIYFPDQIVNITPSWQIMAFEEGKIDLEMTMYFPWDVEFTKYNLSFERVE